MLPDSAKHFLTLPSCHSQLLNPQLFTLNMTIPPVRAANAVIVGMWFQETWPNVRRQRHGGVDSLAVSADRRQDWGISTGLLIKQDTLNDAIYQWIEPVLVGRARTGFTTKCPSCWMIFRARLISRNQEDYYCKFVYPKKVEKGQTATDVKKQNIWLLLLLHHSETITRKNKFLSQQLPANGTWIGMHQNCGLSALHCRDCCTGPGTIWRTVPVFQPENRGPHLVSLPWPQKRSLH